MFEKLHFQTVKIVRLSVCAFATKKAVCLVVQLNFLLTSTDHLAELMDKYNTSDNYIR